MPNRIIKDSIRTSKKVNELSDFQFRLWTYLITYVDDYGRGSADPELLKGLVFTRRKGITEKQIADALEGLAIAGMIEFYEVEGDTFLQFPNWSKHQRIRNSKERFPAPEDGIKKAVCGKLRRVAASCGETRLKSESESESNPNNTISDEMVSPTGVRRSEVQTVVDAWNMLSDRGIAPISRISKGSTREKLLNARLRENGLETVLRAIENVKQSDFLSGRNSRAWIISFDWFIKPSSFDKVLDGNYANHKGVGQNDGLSAVDRAFLEGA